MSEDRLVPISYLTRDLLGMKSEWWFFKNLSDPDLPQRVYVGGQPRLSLQECLAYVETLKSRRAPEGPPAAPEGVRRKPGRPRKIPQAASS